MTTRPRPAFRPTPALATAVPKVGPGFPSVGALLVAGWCAS